jgi:acetolactate synthase-1/2/3 large subunit
MVISGARILLDTLRQNDVSVVFGYPGGACLPLYDELFLYNQSLTESGSKIQHYGGCHEQAIVHAAQGYARSSNKIGVVFLTSGPGATNGTTGIADAMLDSTPLICITSQVPTYCIGTDAFQEADIFSITRPITKHSYFVNDIKNLKNIINEAFYLAQNGRPGPVVIDIPKDIYTQKIDDSEIITNRTRKLIEHKIDNTQIERAVEMILLSQRPVFYCGGGAINASKVITDVAKLTRFPVTTTIMGLGVFDGHNDQSLGMLGMHGSYEANMALYESDLIIAVGVRFDDRVTGKLSGFSPNSKKIHIDIDKSEINKNVKIDLAIVSDANFVFEEIYKILIKRQTDFANIDNWWQRIKTFRDKKSFHYSQDCTKEILPQYALEKLYNVTRSYDTYVTTDVGQHQMWATQYFKFSKPRRFITSAGLGTMGFGMPAAIGCQISVVSESNNINSKKIVLCISGDASILMNIQELGTIKKYKLPVKIIILNNTYLGMVRQWQESFYNNRLSESDFSQMLPDFVKLSNAFDIASATIDNINDLEDAYKNMLENKGPYILNIMVKKDENVYPMIPPNTPHNEMILSQYD